MIQNQNYDYENEARVNLSETNDKLGYLEIEDMKIVKGMNIDI